MGLVHEDWKKWWDGAEAKFEFPKEGDKAITNVKAQRKIDLSYFGIEVSSKKLCFLVDCSSSMLEMVAVGAMATQLELRMPCAAILLRSASQSMV